ncbi:MAG TPA: toll/interleukin-1 receptor domain-containing protein, partial [Gemmatimonadaceae bacterium]
RRATLRERSDGKGREAGNERPLKNRSLNDPDLNVSVLEVLRRRLDDTSDDQKGWTLPITVALALSADANSVLTEFHVLAAADEADLNEQIGGLHTFARITSKGITRLAKLARAKRAVATGPTVVPAATDATYKYDVFVSHASEDTEGFVEPLVGELKRCGVSSWYDRERISHGDSIIRRMNEGLRNSRCGVIVASPDYFGKMFTEPELDALLMRVLADEQRKVIAVLYRMGQRELAEANPILATHIYIDAAQYHPVEIARFIQAAVSPELARLSEPAALDSTVDKDVRRARELGASPFSPGTHDAPYDALPEQPHLVTFRPRIDIAWYDPVTKAGQRTITWTLTNVGVGGAWDVNVFLPGIASYAAGGLAAGELREDTRRFDDRYAYHEHMKPPIQAIVEFADIHRNVYRQYANVSAGPHWNDVPASYETTQFGHPYPVSGRIVQPDTERDRFLLMAPIALGHGPPFLFGA